MCASLPVSCEDPHPAETRSWPSGTAFAVDDLPVSEAEIDLAMLAVHLIDPGYTDRHKRRLALTNLVLPRAVGRLMAGEGREAARREIEALHAKAVAGELTGPPGPDGAYGEILDGPWTKLGMLTWARAFELPPGEWSEVIEEIGHFLIFRVLERRDGVVPAATQFKIDVQRIPYMDPDPTAIDRRYDSTRLTIVDPEWLEIFPEQFLYRMGVRDS